MHATTTRPARRRIVGLAIVVVALAAVVVPVAVRQALSADPPRPPALGILDDGFTQPPGVVDGALPDGPVPPDAEVPAIANLDPALLDAVRRAADAAAVDGVALVVNSGWRSEALQQAMLDEAIVTYGSPEEAARWVSTPDESAHVTGDAVDVGGWDAASWLSAHGSTFGLCQTYANETWHFELRTSAAEGGCPPMADDPTQAH